MLLNKLSNDPHELKKLIIDQNNLLNKKEELIKKKEDLIEKKDSLISALWEQIAFFKALRYGPKSEKIKSEDRQGSFFDEAEYCTLSSTEEKVDEEDHEGGGTDGRSKQARGKRRKLPEFLPRKDEVHDIPEEERVCAKDGKKLTYMGEEISEKLKIIPHKIEVVRTIRKKYVCSCGEYIKIAKLPPTILPKSMATPSLLSYIVTGKYVDGIPLYRFESVMKRHGIDLGRATMGRWMIEVGEKLKTLKELLREELLFSSSYIHCDETVVQVLKEKDKPPESKSYMWVQARSGDKPIVLYDYNPSRSAKVPMDLLKGFKGYLQVDGYAGYNSIGREEDITRVGCMSHCRRYFFRAWKHSKTKNIGSRGLAFIRKLYKIEESIKEYSEEEKKRIRLEKSKPILEEMKAWLDKEGSRHPVKSLGGKAIRYALNEWEFLIRYLEDGRLNISNDFVERAIRPFTIGRKNWLFSDTPKGADASALWYSLIETAKANGHEPFEYILNVLNKIPTANSLEDYMKLLPFNISDKK